MIFEFKIPNPFEGPIIGENETASPGNNETERFFRILFNGNAPEGYLMLWSKDELTKAIPTTDVRQIVETALAFGPKYNVYYGVGIQNAPPIGGSRGNSEGVIAIFGLHLDVDILGPNHKSKELPPDKESALQFVQEFPLKPTVIIFSGGGLQPYWLFKESLVFENKADREKAEALLSRFQRKMMAMAREKGWKLDNTADLARVLRIPGTFNHKNDGMAPVHILEYHPELRYEPDDFEPYLVDNDPIPPKKPAKTTRCKNSLPPVDAGIIEAGCAWFRHCKDDAVGLPEPEWYACFSILGRCTDGGKLAHEWSSPDPRYKPTETDKKLAHALANAGPRSCQNIRYDLNGEEYCQNCPACGLIQNPLQLGLLRKPLPRQAPGAFETSDYGNAECLVSEHGADIRFCFLWDRWYTWNGIRWEQDMTEEVTRKAKNTVRKIKADAGLITDSRQREFLEKHAIRAASLAGIRNMIQLAKSERGIPILPDALDSDPMLLNCLNGTLDLNTGTLLEHNRSDLLSKMAPVNFDPNATCDLWLNFLDTIMRGKQELIEFLQRAIGYSLTGDTSEQSLFFLYGTGANGKSTFLEIIRHLMGDYAKQAEFSTFLAQHSEKVRNDIAGLKGSRLVSAVEVEAGKKLSEVLVKQLTGGDAITARFLYGEFFEFYPTFKVFWVANHKPIIRGSDYGIWRRIHLVPFSVTIPKEQQDRRLLSKLLVELPGILNWAVKGCLDWQKSGLNPPIDVVEATQSYQQEMDVLSDFLADCCVIGPRETVKAKELYEAYTGWCGSNGETSLGKHQFNSTLRERNLNSAKKNGPLVWSGIGLKVQSKS